MKKLTVLLMFVLSMAIAMPNVYGQYDKAKQKAQKKEYKTKMKEFKKEGWKVYGTAHSLDVALLEHYERLAEDGAIEVVGVASAFVSKNVGQQSAMNAACNNYARAAESQVRGRMVSDLSSNVNDLSEEFDKFYAAYESRVEKEIKGELKPSFSVIRSKGKDDKGQEIFEMQSFFVVNEAAASKARLRAMEDAMRESEAAQKYADQVSGFVQEAFTVE